MISKRPLLLARRILKLCFSIFVLIITYKIDLMALKAPTSYNSYDGDAPGAKALSMGFAFSSVADDPSTIYYNPAGLAQVNSKNISVSYEAARLSSLNKDQVFSSDTIKNSGINFIAITGEKAALSYRPLSDEVIQQINGNNWDNTEIKINAYTLTAAQLNENGIMAGINFTYLSGTIAESKMIDNVPSATLSDGRGLSMDIGFLYNFSRIVAFGVNFQNLFGTMWWDNYDKEQLPFGLRGGFSFKIPGSTIFAVELQKEYYRDENPGPDQVITHFGLEQAIGKALKLRAGAFSSDFNDQNQTSYTYGLGYDFSKFKLSLAGQNYKINGIDVTRYLTSLDIRF